MYQNYPTVNRSRCCMKSICTGMHPVPLILLAYVIYEQVHMLNVLFWLLCQNAFFRWRIRIRHVLLSILFYVQLHYMLLLWQFRWFCRFLNCDRCPFCKSPNYAVEYRGVKSKEERGLEQVVRPRFHTKFHISMESIHSGLRSFSFCVMDLCFI